MWIGIQKYTVQRFAPRNKQADSQWGYKHVSQSHSGVQLRWLFFLMMLSLLIGILPSGSRQPSDFKLVHYNEVWMQACARETFEASAQISLQAIISARKYSHKLFICFFRTYNVMNTVFRISRYACVAFCQAYDFMSSNCMFMLGFVWYYITLKRVRDHECINRSIAIRNNNYNNKTESKSAALKGIKNALSIATRMSCIYR